MYEHLKFVCAVTLAELFGKEVDEMEWMLSIFPKHYEHPNSETAKKKSVLFIDKPMYLQETKNSEMFEILNKLQFKYLNFVGEQVKNSETYF